MQKLTTKKEVRLLAALVAIVYFSSYLTRINFAAVLVEFIQAEGVTKSDASMITIVLFVTYGVGQLVSGYMGDRISPIRLIFGGLFVAGSANLLLPAVSPNVGLMAVVWGINGLAQAFMWPPLVKLMTSAMTEHDYARTMPIVTISAACASIVTYLMAPALIRLSGWKLAFLVPAAVALMVAVIWLTACSRLLKNIKFNCSTVKKVAVPQKNTGDNRLLRRLLPLITLTIALQGMLRDGISTWMPTFMSETFHMESTVSILTGVALPVVHLLMGLFTYRALVALKRDVFLALPVFFFVATALLAALGLFGTNTAVMATLLIALVNGVVHSINALQTCYLPAAFQGIGNISLLAGFLNASVYIGSALSTYLFAVISEHWGWNATILSWILCAAVGLGLSLICKLIVKRRS